MLMSELSRRSDVPVATIKFYLREGLLAPGTATAATRAEYDDSHLRRLRLIRSLLEIGEVPLASIRKILDAVDSEAVGLHDMLGTVQYALGPHVEAEPADRLEVGRLITELGWQVSPDAPGRDLLAVTLAALRRSGSAPSGASLRDYAEAMSRLARREVAGLATIDAAPDRMALAESAVVGMVLHERVLIALHRLAQEDASASRYSRT
jgi:DNA-binding transcriptional MerR regulator